MGMGVIVWPKNRMISKRVSSLIDRARFFVARALRLEKSGGRRRARSKEERA